MLCLCLFHFHVMPCWLILILIYHRTTFASLLSVSVRAIIIILNENTQCFCDNDDSYAIYGRASNCDCCGRNVGTNRMCVYKLPIPSGPYPPYAEAEAPGCTNKFNDAPYLGCFADRKHPSALPHQVPGRFKNPKKCQVECNKAGYQYFARQGRRQMLLWQFCTCE